MSMKLCFLLLILTAQAYAAATSQQEEEEAAAAAHKHIFILAGQSNMAGRGGVLDNNATDELTWNEFVPKECQPNPSILRFSANLAWVEAREPLHADIDVKKVNGIGPGMPFAHELLAKEPKYGVIGLVPCAIGGTTIDEWAKGTPLYNQMVRRARTSLVGGGRIRGLLWMQGESDTNTLPDAEAYKPKLEKFFNDVRFDMMSPMLPIVQVAIASAEGPYIDVIRKAQLGLYLPNVVTVDPKIFAVIQPDKLHLTPQSQVKLGTMMADAYMKLVANSTSKLSKSTAPPTLSNFAFQLAVIPLLSFSLLMILTTNSFTSPSVQ
ncbi:hypothetical protein FEM48_Zijuj06G0036600 [Ziziphus jujuba var. spinosa]|uniref:Sialate O-acetylesterase domain-containing protein n=1 Tax=Ziziphus jujuba var. spinosa TaxID=714518 RepID=A0A978V6Y6_ZIZJJ|nr:hypothetical protein FEM48_Zijuj06G0036600 [Ziziphus jujuba var. spinosa]